MNLNHPSRDTVEKQTFVNNLASIWIPLKARKLMISWLQVLHEKLHFHWLIVLYQTTVYVITVFKFQEIFLYFSSILLIKLLSRHVYFFCRVTARCVSMMWIRKINISLNTTFFITKYTYCLKKIVESDTAVTYSHIRS